MTTTYSADEMIELRGELRTVARSIAASQSATAPDRSVAELWRLAGEAGWFGLELAEHDDGAGVTFRETCVVLEELGRSLCDGALTTTLALAIPALDVLAAGDQRDRWLAAAAAGQLRVTVALNDANGGVDASRLAVRADGDGQPALTGSVAYVPDLLEAELVIIPALDASGNLAWFAVSTSAAGVTRSAVDTVDKSRATARLDLSQASAERFGAATDARSVYDWLAQRGAVALAADALGAARSAAAISIEYAQQRRQFGRAIGSFQAVKHACVDMHVAIESSAVALDMAAEHLPAVGEGWSEWTSIAKRSCVETAIAVTTAGVQVLGGIGFTWDHEMHLHVKRALADDAWYGTAAAHRTRLAARLLAGTSA